MALAISDVMSIPSAAQELLEDMDPDASSRSPFIIHQDSSGPTSPVQLSLNALILKGPSVPTFIHPALFIRIKFEYK